jgi:hypothetical protein
MPRGRSDEAPERRQSRLLSRKLAREANRASAETFDEWFGRHLKTKECGASYRRTVLSASSSNLSRAAYFVDEPARADEACDSLPSRS